MKGIGYTKIQFVNDINICMFYNYLRTAYHFFWFFLLVVFNIFHSVLLELIDRRIVFPVGRRMNSNGCRWQS